MFDDIGLMLEFYMPFILPFLSAWFVDYNMKQRRILTNPWHFYWWGIITILIMDWIKDLPKG